MILRSKWFVFYLDVGVLIAASFAGGCAHSGKVSAESGGTGLRTVGVVKVERADLKRQFQTAAEFRAYQEISMYAKVAGYVKEIHVDIGDRVKKGEILATLEIPELSADLEHAQASLARSEEELRRAQGELDLAKAAHEVARLQYERLSTVAKTQPGLVAQQEIDAALGADQQTEAQVFAAKAGLEAAKEELNAEKATLRKEQSLMAYASIVAPFNGVVTHRFADTGAMVAAGTSSEKQALPVVQLAQNDLLRLDIPVPESEVSLIRVGMPVAVSVASLNRTYDGKVVRFARQLDTATRTMMTEIDVPNPQLELIPGMYATATITLQSKPGVLTVPIQAVSKQGDQEIVLRVNERNEIEEQRVKLGLEEPSRAEVISGLKEGDLVIVGGHGELHSGEKVAAKEVQLTPDEGEN
ncbi:MAG: efflux RND transporter periplasmic adaptor subunit [Candidatus Acidiferrales bacterium]